MENEIDMELQPRSFRCSKALGKLLDKYAAAWERSTSFVVNICLRERFKDELPQAQRPKDWIEKK